MHTTLPSGCGSQVEFLTQPSHGSVTSINIAMCTYTQVYTRMCACVCIKQNTAKSVSKGSVTGYKSPSVIFCTCGFDQ